MLFCPRTIACKPKKIVVSKIENTKEIKIKCKGTRKVEDGEDLDGLQTTNVTNFLDDRKI